MKSLAPPSPRAAAWSAFQSGGLFSGFTRPSRRSPSGFVLVALFRSPAAAARFARRAARRSGLPVTVRSRQAVSVPVSPAALGQFAATGGLVPFAASVRQVWPS